MWWSLAGLQVDAGSRGPSISLLAPKGLARSCAWDPLAGLREFYDALFDGLKDLGYQEGRNLQVERRYAEGHRNASRNLLPRWCG